MTAFSSLISALHRRGDALTAVIPDDWMQGRTTYGGLTAALCLEAALQICAPDAPLRSAQISFIGPAGGEVGVRAETLRAGRSMTFAGADLECGGALAARSVFAFGASRQTAFDFAAVPAPNVPSPSESQGYGDPTRLPSFARHYERRLARGALPISGSEITEHYVWVRHIDGDAKGVVALLALADMPPPAVMPMFKAPAPISSATWHLNFLTSSPRTRDGWWLLGTRAENAGEGYSSQEMLVWNADGAPVIAGRQSVAVFA